MAAKKKTVKKTAKKTTKKRVTKAARTTKKATAKKRGVTKAAKKKTSKKVTAKKARAKKAPGKGAVKKAVKKAAARKTAKKTAARKAASKKTPGKAPAAKNGRAPAAVRNSAEPNTPVKLTAFVKKQHQRLLDLRDELMDAMYGVQQETLRNAPSGSEASGSGMHQGDAGSDAYDRDFALNLLSKEQDALHEIEAALKRVSRGSYGICEISGKKIPQARLEAIPFARLTVECQSQWEQEHPHRQFRSTDAEALSFLGGGNIESEAVSLDEEDD